MPERVKEMKTRYRLDYLTGACLSEVNDQGETTVQYNNHPQTGALISERSDGEDIYHHYDGDGNTRQTTDSAGNVLGEATYDAFGETVAESGDMKTTYRFRGQRGFSTDPVTGDVSSANHNYSPSLGRELSGATNSHFNRITQAFSAGDVVIKLKPAKSPRKAMCSCVCETLHRVDRGGVVTTDIVEVPIKAPFTNKRCAALCRAFDRRRTRTSDDMQATAREENRRCAILPLHRKQAMQQ